MRRLTFSEYSGFEIGGETSVQLAHSGLNQQDLAHLRAFQAARKDAAVFDLTSETIKARNYVGVVALPDLQLEILPKLLAGSQDETYENLILGNLMFMLSYTHRLDTDDTGPSFLEEQSGSFIEAYIRIYATRLNSLLIRFGAPKRYEEFSEDLGFVKGRIDFTRDILQNSFNRSRVSCDFSELTENNPVCQAMKFVAIGLRRITHSSINLQTLNRCLGLLDGVESRFIDPDHLDRVGAIRGDKSLKPLLKLLKMFLRKLRPQSHRNGSKETFALLFNMNVLFEEFIFEALKRNASKLGIIVKAQSRKPLVSHERDFLREETWSARESFQTYTDIEIVRLNPFTKIILDTKYKILSQAMARYKILSEDVYQILAYRQINQEKDAFPAVGLIYPKSDFDLHKEFKVTSDSQITFFVATLDLSKDLSKCMPDLILDLNRIVNCA